MNLDRSKFLLLASAISSGCIINTTPSDSGGTPSTDTGSQPGTGGTSETDAETSATSGVDTTAGEAESDGTQGADDTVGADETQGETGEICDDSIGSPDCTDLPEACEAWEHGICEDHLVNFKPAVAEAAIACMHEEQCVGVSTYLCAEEAALGACPDESVADDCETILDNCESATQEDCEQYLAGLTEIGRAAMVDCMSDDFFCSFGFYTCLEGL